MSVKIRLQRQGAKNRPIYSIVAINSADRRDGKYLERLGQYFPKAEKAQDKVKLNVEALRQWQERGAVCSDTVRQLLKAQLSQ